MKFRNFSHLVVGVLSFGATFFVPCGIQAAPEVFTIDSSQSQIALSGTIEGSPINTQGTGSLTTSYSGSINADVSGSTIQFTGSSAIIAETNGVWQPNVGGGSGSAAADYGAQATIAGLFTGYGAARNVVLDLTSPTLTITGTNFDSSALVFWFGTGSSSSFDYSIFVTSGSVALTGYATNTIADGASLTTDGPTQKLTINLDTEFVFPSIDVVLDLTGKIVATRSSVGQLFINSIALSNQNAVLNVANATLQSQLQSSTNLMTWSSAGGTVVSNTGVITFTTPLIGPKGFFRVQK